MWGSITQKLASSKPWERERDEVQEGVRNDNEKEERREKRRRVGAESWQEQKLDIYSLVQI